MIPDWAPNLHPLVVHFPIVLVITAATASLLDALVERPPWLAPMAVALYAAAAATAVVAYWSGNQAAATVHIPDVVRPLVDDHGTWAMATTLFAGALALAHVVVRLRGAVPARRARLGLAAAGLVAVVLIQQTAERGARLVYEQGVGVIPARGAR